MASRAAALPQQSWHDRPATDRVLAIAALVMLAFVLAALARGMAQWDRLPVAVWAHVGLLIVALVLTPVLLLRAKGSLWHRRLGWTWAIAMTTTAIVSFGIRFSNHGGLSWIHLLSAWVTVQAPLLVWLARTHRVERHRRTARTLVAFALLTAGFFTFPFNRLLGQWLFNPSSPAAHSPASTAAS